MGRLLLLGRLAVRDLQRHRTEAALLLLAILAATTTLTLALALRGAAADPYQSTRAATRGPDVVAMAGQPDRLTALKNEAGVIGHSGRSRSPRPSSGSPIGRPTCRRSAATPRPPRSTSSG
jgi:hypothetical protein